MHNNEKLLRDIEHDLYIWKRGLPPSGMTLSLLGLALLVCGYLRSFSGSDMLTGGMIFGGCTILLIQLVRDRKEKVRSFWPEILDSKLARYEPRDMTAWKNLCEKVHQKNRLTVDDLTEWLLAEKNVDVKGGAGRYTFLNTEKGGQSDKSKQ